MKKSHAAKKQTKHPKKAVTDPAIVDPPPGGTPIANAPISEDSIAEDQFAVTGREDEASSSGHRIEPVINDEEGNAEKLIEEGLHGYMHLSKKAR